MLDDFSHKFERSAWKYPIIMMLAVSLSSGIGYATFNVGYSAGRAEGASEATRRVKDCYEEYIDRLLGVKKVSIPKQLTEDEKSLPYYSSFVTSQRELRNCIYKWLKIKGSGKNGW